MEVSEAALVAEILEELRAAELPPPRPQTPKLLPLLIFSDFKFDDLLAIIELWRWRAMLGASESASRGLSGSRRQRSRPIIVFVSDLERDSGSIFEKKLLLARLLLGTTWRDVYALGRSPSEELLAALVKELALVAEASKNEAVDVVLLAAGRGRVAEVFRRMEATHAEALESLRRKARVTVAGGHVVGSEADLECLRKLCAARPLVDISQMFFPGSATALSPPLALLAEHSELLPASLQALQEELGQAPSQGYAPKLGERPELKGNVDSLADQACFLYEWCRHNCHEVLEEVSGNWWLNPQSKSTGVAEAIPEGCRSLDLRALQPQIKQPHEPHELLDQLPSVLESLLVHHLSMLQPLSSGKDVIG